MQYGHIVYDDPKRVLSHRYEVCSPIKLLTVAY